MKINKILVSQPTPTDPKSPYFELSQKYGVEIEFHSFIKVEGVDVRDFRKQRVDILSYTAIVFTSKYAIDHFFRICTETRVAIPETMKYFCISESVAVYLQKYIVYRKRKIFHGTGKFADLTEVMKKHKEEKYLVPLSDIHKEEIPLLLDKGKFEYKIASFYNTVSSDLSAINIKDFDMLVFFSPQGINSLHDNFPNFEQGNTVIGAFGPLTCKAVKVAGLRLDVSAPTPETPSMTMAIEKYIKDNQ